MANEQSVTNVRGNAAGSIHRAPLMDVENLPTDAIADLPAEAANLGMASEDGLTNSFDISNESFVDQNGNTVLTVQTSYEETLGFAFIDTNEAVFKALHGDENVITTESGLTVVHRGKDLDYGTWFFELELTGNRVKRIVVPAAKITEREDVDHQVGELLNYGITLTTRPVTMDIGGTTFTDVTAVEFIAKINGGDSGNQ